MTAEWGARELGAAMRAAVAPWRATGLDQRLRTELSQRLDGAEVLTVNAGRNALRLALELFRSQRPERQQVLIPDYVCPSVVDAVLAAGCQPVTVPVGDDLNLRVDSLEAKISESRPLAIVAVHMYGAPADIEAIEALGRRSGVRVIDDAAQVLGVRVGNRPLGTFGDVGILSFAQSKSIVTGVRGSGGALITRDRQLAREFAARIEPLARAAGRLRHFAVFVLSRRKGRLAQGLAWRVTKRSTTDYEPRRIAGIDAAIARAQLATLDRRVVGRRRAGDAFAARLRAIDRVVMPQAHEGRYLTRVLIELPCDANRDLVRQALAAKGVETRLPYDLEPVARFGPAAGVAGRLLELPSHSEIGDADVAAICDALREALVAAVPIASARPL